MSRCFILNVSSWADIMYRHIRAKTAMINITTSPLLRRACISHRNRNAWLRLISRAYVISKENQHYIAVVIGFQCQKCSKYYIEFQEGVIFRHYRSLSRMKCELMASIHTISEIVSRHWSSRRKRTVINNGRLPARRHRSKENNYIWWESLPTFSRRIITLRAVIFSWAVPWRSPQSNIVIRWRAALMMKE